MQIGELSKATETAIETIRFYEREQLIPSAERTAGNYRIYSTSHLEQLRFIRNCRALDMSLEEIRELMELREQGDGNCHEVDLVLDRHLEHVSNRIKELRRLEKELRAIRESCGEPRTMKDCRILGTLSSKREDAMPVSRKHTAISHPR